MKQIDEQLWAGLAMPPGLEEIVREAARDDFGEPDGVHRVGTATCILVYPDHYIKVRYYGGGEMNLWMHRQIPGLPPVLKVVDHCGRRLKFVEWWSGEEFPGHHEKLATLSPELFKKYGEFVKGAQWGGVHIADGTWRNVLRCADRGTVINCDLHRQQLRDCGYVEKILSRLTDEQGEAFMRGVTTTKQDLLELAEKFGGGFLQGPHYQPIDVADIHVAGKRSRYRFELMDMAGLAGKKVLDLGCGRGMCCFEAADNGAEYVLGIESEGEPPLTLAAWNNALAAYARYEDVEFKAFDIDADWELFTRYVNKLRWDAVFCFSLLRHLDDPPRLMNYIDGATDLLYFEGQLDETREQVEEKIGRLTTFKYVDYLGNASEYDLTPAVRHLYRCSR